MLASVPEDPFAFLCLCKDRMVNIHASSGTADAMHTPLAKTTSGKAFLRELRAADHTRLVTFELEDLNFQRHLGYEEMNAVLQKEAAWFSDLRSIYA